MKPNFQPKDIEKTIIELTKKGLEIANSAAKGDDWDSVVAPLDQMEFE